MKLHHAVCPRLVGIFLGLLCGLSFARGAEKPNVVFIMADDAAYSDFGFSAALNGRTTSFETPNLDALAQQSVVASQAYVAHSLCSPTRAGLLTGQFQQRFGYEDNISTDVNSTQGLVAEQVTIAQRLKPLGYTTGIIGKWHLGYTDGVNRPLDKGFDEFYGLLGGGRYYFHDTSGDSHMWKNNQPYEAQYRQEGDQSKYDPVKGRYVTDAWGEEAVDFIDRHANDENPFFLYLSFTTPHTPQEAKQADLDHFASITDPTRRAIAAMTYAMDRSIGDVLDALATNGLDENTIVVFTNDNGATSYVGNPPFKGHKGTTWEGGIRVPLLVKGPGLEPGVYDSPISFFDMLPTIVTAAGGDVSQFPHDGHDVMPYLKGEGVEDPNRVLFWRSGIVWAVRKGDWKLESPYADSFFLHNIAEDTDENYYQYYNTRPDIVADLLRELTNWEAQMAKPKWSSLGIENQNLFDHFVFRTDQGNAVNWSTASAWEQADTAFIATLKPGDAYPNAVLEFGVRDDGDYVAANDMTRSSRRTFMLNQLRLTGNLTSVADRQATINGNKVLFVRSLNGELPSIRLDATSGTSANFTFRIDNELQLLHDLEITGNGTQNFIISGSIRDYYEVKQPEVSQPHSVRKLGSSAVTLTGNNTFAGSLTIESGELAVDGTSGAIDGASSVVVESGAKLALRGGLIRTPSLVAATGSIFQFTGGTLKVNDVTGNLVNSGGNFAPGMSTAISSISQGFTQSAGVLQIEIGGVNPGTGFDKLQVGGSALLGGALQVQLLNGFSPLLNQSFQVLTADDGIAGMFGANLLPVLPAGLAWQVVYRTNGVTLNIAPTGQQAIVSPVGDFNRDGTVNAADYSVWRNSLGSSTVMAADGNGDNLVNQDDYAIWKNHFGLTWSPLAGDFNFDGHVNAADYTIWRNGLGETYTLDDYDDWKANFGASPPGSGSAASASVPEPAAWLICLVGLLAGAVLRVGIGRASIPAAPNAHATAALGFGRRL
jgi:autotransporter-associated beta strand protein